MTQDTHAQTNGAKCDVMDHITIHSDTDSEELHMFLPIFLPEEIVISDNSSAKGDYEEAIPLNTTVGEDHAGLPQNVVEDLLSQSGLSPLSPAFSPSFPVSLQLSNPTAATPYQRSSQICNICDIRNILA